MKFKLDEKSLETLRRIKEVEYYQNLGMNFWNAFVLVNKTIPELNSQYKKKPKLTLIKSTE